VVVPRAQALLLPVEEKKTAAVQMRICLGRTEKYLKAISPSLEDYLEAIYQLAQKNTAVHMSDVALRLNVSKASVNRAMKTLKDHGYITQEHYRPLSLTKDGAIRALEVVNRHTLLRSFLVDHLGVSCEVAEEDACRMEHAVSAETIEKLESYMSKH
jgi:Mn-dependent transcriptional regulator